MPVALHGAASVRRGGLPAVTPPTASAGPLLKRPVPFTVIGFVLEEGVFPMYFSLLSGSSSEIVLSYPSLTLQLLQALTRERCFPITPNKAYFSLFKGRFSPQQRCLSRVPNLEAVLEKRHSQVSQLVSPVPVQAAPPGGAPNCGGGGS